MKRPTAFLMTLVGVALAAAASAQEVKPVAGVEVLKSLVGKWEGNCLTWFEPGKLADESKITGEFVEVLDGRYVRHAYVGSMQGKPRRGEELLAFNPVSKLFQSSWIDDFHMNSSILFSEGARTEHGFSVRGDWDADKQTKWGWRTEYTLVDKDHLTITSYNIVPQGLKYQAGEYKAVEVTYHRVTRE